MRGGEGGRCEKVREGDARGRGRECEGDAGEGMGYKGKSDGGKRGEGGGCEAMGEGVQGDEGRKCEGRSWGRKIKVHSRLCPSQERQRKKDKRKTVSLAIYLIEKSFSQTRVVGEPVLESNVENR